MQRRSRVQHSVHHRTRTTDTFTARDVVKANAIVSEILDYAEHWVVRKGLCAPEEVMNYLTLQCIKDVSGIMGGATVYMPNDERLGFDVFLLKYSRGKLRARFTRNASLCAIHLRDNVGMYFPRYYENLMLAFLATLRRVRDPIALGMNGTILLAVGTLDGALYSVRRELRNRGLSHDKLLIVENGLLDRLAVHMRRRKLIAG